MKIFPLFVTLFKKIFTFLAFTILFKGESIVFYVFFNGWICSVDYEEDSVYY